MKTLLLTSALTVMAGSACALDFDRPILGVDGKPQPVCSEKTPECQKLITLGFVAETACFADYPDERDPRGGQTITGEEKAHRGALGIKIAMGGNVVLNAEDLALIRKLIGKAFPPLTVVRAWDMLDAAVK